MTRRWLRALTLALPLVVLAGIAAEAALTRANYPSFEVRIQGYDPRDPLRGHYLLFRPDWAWADESAATCPGDTGCCLCLTGGPVDPAASLVACGPDTPAPASCLAVVSGYWRGATDVWVQDLDRYFVPEAHARRLETLLREDAHAFRIAFAVTPGGRALIRNLTVDGKPLRGFLSE